MSTPLMEGLLFALYSTALISQVENDKHGEHISEKKRDIVVYGAVMVICSFVAYLVSDHVFFDSLAVCFALHFAFFDYIIVVVLRRNKVIVHTAHWFTYLGGGPFDTWAPWVWIGPWGRAALKALVLIASIMFYFRLNVIL